MNDRSVATLASIVPARDRCVPVDEVFASMLPDAGLMRGRVVGCTGPAAMSLGLALASRAVVTGSWLAVVGVPKLGVEAAAELGVPLSRMVHIDTDGSPTVWAERVAAAADGFEVVIVRPPAGAVRVMRRVRQRLQARGVVTIALEPAPGVGCDLEFSTVEVGWSGLGRGHGHLHARRVVVRLAGRRVARPVERTIWLPGHSGRVVAVDGVVLDGAEPVVDDELRRVG